VKSRTRKETIMKTLRWMLVPLALSVVAPAFAAPPAPSASSERVDQKKREMRGRMLRDRVGLSDDKARRVEAVLEKYGPERKRVHSALRDAKEKLRSLVAGKSDDQAAYRAALDQLRSSRKALLDLMERAFGEVSKELTPKEQAKLFLALDELHMGMGRGMHHGHGPRHMGHDEDPDDD